MPTIAIKVRNKVAVGDGSSIICDNSDYTVNFDLDSEWDSFTNRTMRVGYYGGTYTDVLFTGTTASLPTISGKSIITIGLYAGDIHTSTPATFNCEKSAISNGGTPVSPTPSVYNQIIERLDSIDDELEDKQDELTAGTGITIDANNVISATGTGSVTRESIVTALGSASPNLSANDYDATEKASVASSVSHIADATIHVTSSDKSTWNGKQDAITSSTDLTANSLSVGALKDKTGEHVFAEYIDSYEEWYLGDGSTPINATDASAFYVPATDASGASDQAATKLYVDDHHDSTKQDTLTAGTGISISNNVISTTDVTHQRFGVYGVGKQNATLSRLWDAAGFVNPVPGTDTIEAYSPFDGCAPFNRKKCVGSWSLDTASATPKAKFTVQAYYGDADYAEDGTMGDYVAVEVEPFYYYEKDGVLGVSEHQYSGWSIHPVCVDLDGNIRAKTYLPCYAMGMKNGKPVSLPGYHNEFGAYKTLCDKTKLYGDGTLLQCTILELSVVNHYEWLLMTIEYATQNMQTFMMGAVSMAYNSSHTVHSAPEANNVVLTAAIGDNFVVGQSIMFDSSHSVTPSSVDEYNLITAIAKCNEDGTLNTSGTYRLITYSGTDRSASITADTTKISSRPWVSGATQGAVSGVGAVLGHTGSPVSNTSGKYSNLYRWRENVYGNQHMTAMDVFNARVVDGSGYRLDWYYLYDPREFYPYPNLSSTDLLTAENGFVKLSVTTPKESYENGYIKELNADPLYPCILIPTLTIGGSASTYYSDFAYLVSGTTVRSVCYSGHLNYGTLSGIYHMYAWGAAYGASSWFLGSGLYFIQ